MKYRKTAAQRSQNDILAEIFLKDEFGEKNRVISPLNREGDVIWFVTMDSSGKKFRNEIRVFEVA